LPSLPALLAIPQVHVHFYGKSEKPARKIGHVTVRAGTEEERDQRIAQVVQVMQESAR
jgi:5-(carboxyamino)imidazole ribonucleotide synthase